MVVKVIELIIGAIISLFFGLIAKKLDKIEKNREMHREAFAKMQGDFRSLETKIQTLTTIVSESEMRNARYRIIRFDDEETTGIRHSDDHWDQILEDIDIYTTYCDCHPEFHNHKGQGAMQRILAKDQERRMRYV